MRDNNEIISAREAARRLGRGTATVEQGLRDKTFPVGTAYRTAAGRWVYIIPKVAFERFLAGEINNINNIVQMERRA